MGIMQKGWLRLILVLSVMAINIAADQITKEVARLELAGTGRHEYLGGFFNLIFVENEGAFLSLGAGLAEGTRYLVLTIFPILVLTGIFFYALLSPALNRWQVIAYSFILGGGISNIYDRLLFGKVVDFMIIDIGKLQTGIFNFADVSIMIGLFMMIPYLFHLEGKGKG